MRVTLDQRQMRDCMALWRHELTVRQSDHDPASVGRAEQARILASLNGTLSGWLDLLRLCTADDTDSAAFRQIKDEVTIFKAWVDEARMALSLLQDAKSVSPIGGATARRRPR